jgi:hypothetical protein
MAGFPGSARLTEETGRDVPMLTVLSNHRDGFLVVARTNADHDRSVIGLKRDAITDLEVQHFGVRPHVTKGSADALQLDG